MDWTTANFQIECFAVWDFRNIEGEGNIERIIKIPIIILHQNCSI